jgi:hypothetical protein
VARLSLITMSKEHYYKVTTEGSVRSVTHIEAEVNLESTIMSRFATDVAYKSNCLVSAGILPETPGLGNIGICMRKSNVVFTVRMAYLPFRTAFTMKNGFMVPDFKKGDADPEFVLNWVPPESMRLYLVTNFIYPMQPDVQFLIAMDTAGRHYRLPLSNLFEDSKLCHGEYTMGGSTLIDMVSRAWAQFHKSRWQSHLADRGTDSAANSQRLFRFKALEPEGFEQVPLDKGITWESLSTRVSVAFISENIVI